VLLVSIPPLSSWVQYLIEGFPVGCVFGLVAVGLVLTYKTSGVFNLAFGAQAFLSAAVMYALNQRGLPNWLCFVISVLVVAPLFGLLLDRALFRYMRNSSWVVKLVSSLGLFVALPEIIKALITGPRPQFNAPSLATLFGIKALAGSSGVFHVGSYVINPDFATIVIVTLVVVLALFVLFRYTALGLRMRAIVESFRMVELAGVDSEGVSMSAWMLSSFLAGLAGVLLAPLISVDASGFTLLLVSAVAAAAFGRLVSIPLALAGGLILGIGQRAIIGFSYFWHWPQSLQTGVRPALPFLALFLALIFLPAVKGRREVTDPLSGVDPPPPAMAHEYKDAQTARLTKMIFPVFIAAFVVVVCFLLSDLWVFRITDALTLAVAFLSITVFTGLGGQVSLGQAAFAGIGGYTVANLAAENHWPVLLALVAGIAIAAVVGALLAVPALRLGGIFLTLATLAFGLMADNIVFSARAVAGGAPGIDVARPSFLNGNSLLGRDQMWFLFVFACFGLVGFLVIFIRNGTIGRFFAGLRGSETAAAAIGINGTRQRILLFALSAGIAGLGGGLIALQAGHVDSLTFPALFGVAWIVLVVSLGSRTVDGALNAALGFVIFQWLLGDYFKMDASIALIGFGFGAITYARHPEGIVEFRTRESLLARRKAVLMKERIRTTFSGKPMPEGFVPTRTVTMPVFAGFVVLLVVVIVNRIVASSDSVAPWVVLVCVGPSLLYAVAWSLLTNRRLARETGFTRSWAIMAGAAVVGAGLGWFLTNTIVEHSDFGDPLVAISAATWVAVVIGAFAGYAIAAFFVLPVQVARCARARDWRTSPVSWLDGRTPTLWVVIATFVCYWTTKGWSPPFLWPLYLLAFVAFTVLVQWIGAVQGGINELAIGEIDVAPGVPLADDGLPEELPALAGRGAIGPGGDA